MLFYLGAKGIGFTSQISEDEVLLEAPVKECVWGASDIALSHLAAQEG